MRSAREWVYIGNNRRSWTEMCSINRSEGRGDANWGDWEVSSVLLTKNVVFQEPCEAKCFKGEPAVNYAQSADTRWDKRRSWPLDLAMQRPLVTSVRAASSECWVISPALDRFKREWEVRSQENREALKGVLLQRRAKKLNSICWGERVTRKDYFRWKK